MYLLKLVLHDLQVNRLPTGGNTFLHLTTIMPPFCYVYVIICHQQR